MQEAVTAISDSELSRVFVFDDYFVRLHEPVKFLFFFEDLIFSKYSYPVVQVTNHLNAFGFLTSEFLTDSHDYRLQLLFLELKCRGTA